VLAFFMGAGWMGLACLKEWETGSLTAFLASFTFGLALMVMNAAEYQAFLMTHQFMDRLKYHHQCRIM
jgi:ABC-type uncharacterized transport system permease subunit